MTVRIVSGGGADGGGEGPTIRVRVVGDLNGDPKAMALAAEEPISDAPPLLEPPAPKEEPQPEPKPAETVAAVEPAKPEPPRVETKVEVSEQSPKEAIPAPIVEAVADTKVATAEAAEKPKEAIDQTPAVATPTRASPVAAENPTDATPPLGDPQGANAYSLRNAPGRLGLVEQEGGGGHTEAAVDAALQWLAAAQSRDGRWNATDYGAGQEHMILGQNRGGAGRNADTGISALAILTFLGAGQSHLHGEYQDNVKRGVDFLLRTQAADGSLYGDSTLYAQMYCHSMATFALAETLAMTGDKRLEPAVGKAIDFCVRAQNTSVGGWRYRPGDPGDTSQLGWQMMALASASRGGISIPSQTWSSVERFLHSVRRGERGGLASYRPDGPATTSMTAEALYCRLLFAETIGGTVDETAAEEATRQLLSAPPTRERINLYYWYYATLALHHRHRHDDDAASAWKKWNEAMVQTIVSTQVTSGANAGSWDTNCVWAGYGGRVYTTSLAAMCLEVYYRYAPTPEHTPLQDWTATRPRVDDRPR
jgi:hypothetical protein